MFWRRQIRSIIVHILVFSIFSPFCTYLHGLYLIYMCCAVRPSTGGTSYLFVHFSAGFPPLNLHDHDQIRFLTNEQDRQKKYLQNRGKWSKQNFWITVLLRLFLNSLNKTAECVFFAINPGTEIELMYNELLNFLVWAVNSLRHQFIVWSCQFFP